MNTQKYNGWSNYETWLCNMWFNDFNFTDMMDMFDNCEDNCDVLDIIANYIKEYVAEFVEYSLPPASQHGFIHDMDFTDMMDMFYAAISEIDWRDIAEHYVDDVVDELELIRDDQKEEIMKLV